MWDMTSGRKTYFAGLVALFSLLVFLAWIALTARVPLTYDEGWNWLSVASQGIKYSYFSYDKPNNHTLFTMLQSRLSPALVTLHPTSLRLFNIAAVAALAILLVGELESGWIVSSVLVASPMFTLYLLVARGYLIGAVLVLSAILLAVRGRYSLAGACVGLAACDVPTFAFVAPGLALFSFFSSRARRGPILLASLALAVPAVFYLPKIWLVLRMRHSFNRALTLHELLLGTAQLSTNKAWFSAVLIMALLLAFVLASPGIARQTSLGLIASCLSYFGCIVILVLLGGINPPFLRNGMFVPLFAWIALALLASVCPPRFRLTYWGLMLANGVFGIALLFHCFVGSGTPLDYPGLTELCPVPGRQISSLPVARMTAAWAAAPAAQLYANQLGVPLTQVMTVSGDCIVGEHPPSQPYMAIVVETKDGHRGLGCFSLKAYADAARYSQNFERENGELPRSRRLDAAPDGLASGRFL